MIYIFSSRLNFKCVFYNIWAVLFHILPVVTRLTVFFNGDIYSLGIVIVSFIMNLNVSDFLLCLTMLLIDLLIKLVFLLILSLGSNLSSHLSLIPND